MEDATNILGAGTLHTTPRITLPMALPAILGGAIVTFLEAIALFGSPALIAIPARFNVVTTQLLQFFSQPVRRRGFVALTGKGGECSLLILSLAVLLPYIVLTQARVPVPPAKDQVLRGLHRPDQPAGRKMGIRGPPGKL